MKYTKTIFITEAHLHAAVEQYLHSLRMIPEDETVIEVANSFGDVRITTKKE